MRRSGLIRRMYREAELFDSSPYWFTLWVPTLRNAKGNPDDRLEIVEFVFVENEPPLRAASDSVMLPERFHPTPLPTIINSPQDRARIQIF